MYRAFYRMAHALCDVGRELIDNVLPLLAVGSGGVAVMANERLWSARVAKAYSQCFERLAQLENTAQRLRTEIETIRETRDIPQPPRAEAIPRPAPYAPTSPNKGRCYPVTAQSPDWLGA